jgi:hypothetical protein
MIRWVGRVRPPSHLYDLPNVLRVVLPWIGFNGLVDTAFEQIRHYGTGDVAVSLPCFAPTPTLPARCAIRRRATCWTRARRPWSRAVRHACRTRTWPGCADGAVPLAEFPR